jgi:hypothetical protein
LLCLQLVSCLAYSSAPKMRQTCSSETLVDFQWATQHYIAEGSSLITSAVRTSDLLFIKTVVLVQTELLTAAYFPVT